MLLASILAATIWKGSVISFVDWRSSSDPWSNSSWNFLPMKAFCKAWPWERSWLIHWPSALTCASNCLFRPPPERLTPRFNREMLPGFTPFLRNPPSPRRLSRTIFLHSSSLFKMSLSLSELKSNFFRNSWRALSLVGLEETSTLKSSQIWTFSTAVNSSFFFLQASEPVRWESTWDASHLWRIHLRPSTFQTRFSEKLLFFQLCVLRLNNLFFLVWQNATLKTLHACSQGFQLNHGLRFLLTISKPQVSWNCNRWSCCLSFRAAPKLAQAILKLLPLCWRLRHGSLWSTRSWSRWTRFGRSRKRPWTCTGNPVWWSAERIWVLLPGSFSGLCFVLKLPVLSLSLLQLLSGLSCLPLTFFN